VHCIQTAEHVTEILSLSDRPTILVVRDQGFLRKCDGFIPNGDAENMGVAIFDQYAAISETVTDRGIFTIEDEYKVVYVLYRIVPLSMTFSDPEPQLQGHSIV